MKLNLLGTVAVVSAGMCRQHLQMAVIAVKYLSLKWTGHHLLL